MKAIAWDGDWPVSQHFGVNPLRYARFDLAGHNGLDVALPEGTQVYSPETGTVQQVGDDPDGYGLFIKVLSDQGESWLLAHLSDTGATKEGDWVAQCTPVGLSGTTGNSSGPHLHISTRRWDAVRDTPYNGWSDPYSWLRFVKAFAEQTHAAAFSNGQPTFSAEE